VSGEKASVAALRVATQQPISSNQSMTIAPSWGLTAEQGKSEAWKTPQLIAGVRNGHRAEHYILLQRHRFVHR
jgi:hypothetical protein